MLRVPGRVEARRPVVDVPHVVDGATLWPVSVKAVVRAGDSVLLAFNERDEWELLGGKLEVGEDPQGTAVREVLEESGLVVDAGPILDSWVYRIDEARSVLIVTYDCPVATVADVVVSHEHAELRWFTVDELDRVQISEGYLTSISTAMQLSRES